MPKKKTKGWCYEPDCQRIERIISETAKHGGVSAAQWAVAAHYVIAGLRKTRAESTVLALHFVSLSGQEMLEDRHTNAKLCLLTALSLAERALMTYQMAMFYGVFSAPSSWQERFSAEIAKLKNEIKELPGGEGSSQLGPGVKAGACKKPEDPKLNTKCPISVDPILVCFGFN